PFRFYFGALGALFVMVFGRVVYNAPLYNIPVILSAFVIISLINASGCTVNDYFDREADAISKPYRPIPAGDISSEGALQYAAVTFIVGTALALYISRLAFVIVLGEMLFLTMYPSIFKRLSGLVAGFLMGLALGFIPIFSEALLLGQISYLSLAFVPMTLVGGVQANVFTDIVTTRGDAKVGYTTVAVTRGIRTAIAVVVATSVWGIFLIYLPYVLGIVGFPYAVVITASAFGRFYIIQSLLRKPTVENVKCLKWTASFMASEPIALLAGAFL
ncbi:MAG: UbiA prenyltransferase family protein, partial [Halobacteriota archaeon]